MPAIPLSSAKPAGSSYYKDHANYEVEDLHHFMEHRHLCLEKKHCADDDDTRDPGTKQRARVSPVEELVAEALVAGFRS